MSSGPSEPSVAHAGHQADLSLATACADGDEAAWERFVREFRPGLHRAADAIDPTGGGRDLADELFAELYGLRVRDGERQSLFRYFQGRSSLATWLRAVLAQRHIDRIRKNRRLVPLPDNDEPPEGSHGARPRLTPAGPDDSRCRAAVRTALTDAIGELQPRDRMRLLCYYVQDMTLAAIGRMFNEHEASASRHLTRVRRELRVAVEQSMRQKQGFGEEALADCLRSVMSDAGDLDLNLMLARTGDRIVQDKEESSDH